MQLHTSVHTSAAPRRATCGSRRWAKTLLLFPGRPNADRERATCTRRPAPGAGRGQPGHLQVLKCELDPCSACCVAMHSGFADSTQDAPNKRPQHGDYRRMTGYGVCKAGSITHSGEAPDDIHLLAFLFLPKGAGRDAARPQSPTPRRRRVDLTGVPTSTVAAQQVNACV